MKKTMKAILIAASAAISTAGAVHAMSDEEMIGVGQMMLISQIENTLDRRGIPSDGIENLTLGEVVQLKDILQGNETPENQMQLQATSLLEEAATR